MTLGNFQEIVIYIVGSPINETQAFLIYFISLCLGCGFLLLIFELFRLIGSFSGGRARR